MITEAEIRHLGAVSSTNDEARALIGEVAHPVWCIANEQTKGIGRRGRSWVSPKGNFYGSLLLPCCDPPDTRALRSFVAALALSDALGAALPGLPISLKWPNDVLVAGRKIAGILLEGLPDHLIIGIGVNLVTAPSPSSVEARAVRPVALSDIGPKVAPDDLADGLARSFARRDAQFVNYGFDPIRQDWLAQASGLGTEITARLPNREIAGLYETVDEQGALVLKTPTGRERITAADIFFSGTDHAACD
ncbi:MAG: biotin--[acetyl-CoA-carboxylase] ligase [Pseudomonadota bacterium]